MSKKVIVGGTFDRLHIGHEKLLRRAIEEGKTIVGFVSDEMLKDWKPEVDHTYEERKKELEEFLSVYDDWSIVKIDDPFKMAVKGDHDALVVSYETKERGEKINEMREERGKEPLELIEVEPVLAEDLLPIKSTRIRQGEIDEGGRRTTPVKVHLGSKNPLKKEIVNDVLSEYFEIEMECGEVEGLEEQPFGEEIVEGADKRAQAPENFDYGIGIESGIVKKGSDFFSVEYVTIKDKSGFTSTGHGPGFPIPEKWIDELKTGITLGKKMKVIFGEGAEKKGAIGLLTDGEVDRKDCIEAALHSAMIPRLNAELYY